MMESGEHFGGSISDPSHTLSYLWSGIKNISFLSSSEVNTVAGGENGMSWRDSSRTPTSHIVSKLLSGYTRGESVSGGSAGFYKEGRAVGAASAVKSLLNSSVNLLASAGVETGGSRHEYGIANTQEAVGIENTGIAGIVSDVSHAAKPIQDYYYVNDSIDYIGSFQEQLLNHSTFKMRDELVKYANPMLIVLGNISNLMALVVLRRKKFKRSSIAFYLAAYAVANLLVLNLMLGLSWALYIFELKHVTYIADWTCRLWMFLSNVITYSGIWIVVAMNLDRLFYLAPRSNTQASSTRFSAKVVVVVIVVLLIVVSIHAMWTYELRRHGCFVAFERNDLHTIIWPWWSAAVYSYIPLFSLIALNVVQAVVLCMRYFRQGDGTAWGMIVSRYESDGMDNFVLTVMTISLHFFFLTVPATVMNVLDIHLPSSWLQVDVIARIELAKKITEQMSSLNHSLLGLHLILCSPDFRREFAQCCRAMFRCRSGSNRPFKTFELHGGGGGGCGAGGGGAASNSDGSSGSPHRGVDYELCNSNEYRDGDMTITAV